MPDAAYAPPISTRNRRIRHPQRAGESSERAPVASRPDLAKTLAQVVGFLAGFVGLLYAVGGGVLAARLSLEHLPSLTIVGQLPREFLVAQGLTQIVLPALGAAAAYAIFHVLRRDSQARPRRLVRQWHERSRRGWIELVSASAVLGGVAILAGVAPALDRKGTTRELWWLIGIGWALSTVVMLVVLNLRARVAATYAATSSRRREVASMAALVALASLPAWMVFSGTFRLLDAKACTSSGAVFEGVLIGETANRIYIGDIPRRKGGSRRVVSIPLAQLQQVFIGGDAAGKSCGPSRQRER